MQMTYLFLCDYQLVVALLWIMRHFFHVIFWVTNVDFCLYTEFLNSRNQFFVSNSRKCFSVLYLDFRESPYQDLGVRALLGHFPWLYFSCLPPVLGLHVVSLLTAVCRFFSQRSHGFVCLVVMSSCWVMVARRAVSIYGTDNGQTLAEAHGGPFSAPLGPPDCTQVFPNLRTQYQLGSRIQLPLLLL